MTPTELHVPFNRAGMLGREMAYVTEAMSTGVMDGDGQFTRQAGELLAGLTKAQHVLLTTSCTHALELAALLLDLNPGDEVIMPSFTFPSTANAFALRGAVPVFVDCRADTLNIDERLIEAAVTERTRAIVVVHYAGVGCAMEEIQRIADRHGISVIEDNAHGLAGAYRGRPLGSFGALAAQSFHSTKNVHCGEGGALLINNPDLVERAEMIRDKGTNRNEYFRRKVDKYRWVSLGSSYLLSDLLAAFLSAQLEALPTIQARRHAVWNAYHEGLAVWAGDNGVVRPTVPADCLHSGHIYYLLLPDQTVRKAFLEHLARQGIKATFHYQPLHQAPAGERFGRCAPEGCPISTRVADQLVRLPLYSNMTDAEAARVVAAITDFVVS
ncbi:dTDP-4-amino-4,6-dideoxygalactose transaminase [Crossiella sp. CA-258035]|uniref:dTDP-4-amino-4,6-dideoxygalactose transaminase n=1 Tax=Crossiella sp. CA-258035 TaxID=2981138 RepID=UPI0024BD4A6F|nr:dTDP-4-amino-4,6-dideoxygalactose transaminase [Crossiella sp. CA-258035]WHT23324.1 dTDP-4-amino-4,6-dideoxygalactose transaminase [Crossiella sp. CA-258035]